MTPLDDLRVVLSPLPEGGRRQLLRWLCPSNPFYVLSAVMFLAGLWASFGVQAEAVQTWSLMSGLGGYTLLLAVTACLLVRFGNVWDDVRTVLLLVVLMFLATSVTFDDVLINHPERGTACCLGGLLFAIVVSEGLLRGTRLMLPAWFRAPYYLILALFFLYPLALSRLAVEPTSEALVWGLFGFCAAAGVVFLSLLPAVRRGPDYVRANGSPWSWPLYPWVLFGVLGLAVPARAFLLCWSMHLLKGRDQHSLIFGPYFLIPFALAVAVLLLEAGIVGRRRLVLAVALATPAGLVALALVGHQPDPVYQGFLTTVSFRLGGDPLYLTLLIAAGFYAYAALRGAFLATEGLTAVLAALAVVGPDTLGSSALIEPRPAPILGAAVLQLGLGLWRRQSWRCLAGVGGLGTVVALAPAGAGGDPTLHLLAVFHVALFGVLFVGASFRDVLGRVLRLIGAALVVLASLAVLFGPLTAPAELPPDAARLYPLALATLLAGYGWLLGHRVSQVGAALILACWSGAAGWRGYRSLREVVIGLDLMALSLGLFALAVLVSLTKSGALARWVMSRRRKVYRPAG
jgi:hypothetical protein